MTSANLTPASGRQDHTALPSASRAVRRRHISVHRIPPHVRDDRETPLMMRRDGVGYEGDLGRTGMEIFLRMGLDWANQLELFQQIAPCAQMKSRPPSTAEAGQPAFPGSLRQVLQHGEQSHIRWPRIRLWFCSALLTSHALSARLLGRLDVPERNQQREVVGDLEHSADNERQPGKGGGQQRS
jgi:hypothetical protein